MGKKKDLVTIEISDIELFKKSTNRGRPRIFQSPQEIIEEYTDFLEFCAGNDRIPTIVGFCLFAGINRSTFYEYARRPEFSNTIKEIRNHLEDFIEQGMLKEKGNPTKWIAEGNIRFNWDKREDKDDKEIPAKIVVINNPKDDKEELEYKDKENQSESIKDNNA